MPITAADCFAGSEISEPRLSPDGRYLAWVRSGLGETRIVVRSIQDPAQQKTSPWAVRAGRSLGGGCFEWMPDGRHLVVVTIEGGIRLWGIENDSDRPLIADEGRTISSPMPNPTGERIAYVVDQAEIHEFDVLSSTIRRVDRGDFEFVLDPVWWRSGLVWQAWSRPHMPWNESCLVSEHGVLHGTPDTQYQQPQSSVDGESLGWVDDSSGWLNVVVDHPTGRVAESFEHAGPTWGERQRSWCFDPDGRGVAYVRNESGFGRLCTYEFDTGDIIERARAVHGQLSWRGNVLAALRTGGRTPTQVVLYDTRGDEWQRSVVEIGPLYSWGDCDALVEPELVRIPTEGSLDLHARVYRSPHDSRQGSDGTEPDRRLLCWIHGGPTDQWQVSFMPRFAYWLDRGYDILVPDFRGSTGHGREYTQALNGRWGELDVDDVETILEGAQARFGYSGRQSAVIGSSAGGLTATRLAARRPDLVAAAVVAYPVTDIAGLDEATHRFEAHYNRSLIGDSEVTERLSAERSPLACVDDLARVPLLIFHGSDDHVVPIEHSRRLVEELRQRSADVEFVTFDGEGHGFRKLENKTVEFERTEEFLRGHLGG